MKEIPIKDTYEYDLINRLVLGVNTLLNPRHSVKIKGLSQEDVFELEQACSVLERLYDLVGDDVTYE